MKNKNLATMLEDANFIVHKFTQDGKKCAEVETWTEGGVNMIITLQPFTKKEFLSYVEDFSVDEEIDSHRQDQRYKDAFKISESVKDFEAFHNSLKEVVALLTKQK